MNQNFIPTDDQIFESVRGQMLHELVDEYSVDLLSTDTEDRVLALRGLSAAVVELGQLENLEDIAEFMDKRGYSIVNVIGMVIEAFRLPKDQARALQNTIAKV